MDFVFKSGVIKGFIEKLKRSKIPPSVYLFLFILIVILTIFFANFLNQRVQFQKHAQVKEQVSLDRKVVLKEYAKNWNLLGNWGNLNSSDVAKKTTPEGVLINVKKANSGISQTLTEQPTFPLKAEAGIKVIKGKVVFSIIDEKGREIFAGATGKINEWEKITGDLIPDQIDGERIVIKEIRIYSTEPNSQWYIRNISLKNIVYSPVPVSRIPGAATTITLSTEPKTLRVMLVSVNPVENGQNLVDYLGIGGGSPKLQEETYIRTNVNLFSQVSGGLVNYQLTKTLEIGSFPFLNNDPSNPSDDGFQYNFASFTGCFNQVDAAECENRKRRVNHIKWITDNRICEIAQKNNIDEIWSIAAAYVMNWENFMIGPNAGFDVNGPYYIVPNCQKHYIVRGGTYGFGTFSLSHIYGHSIERVMTHFIGPVWGERNKRIHWNNFARTDLYGTPSTIVGPFPGAFCGNIHWSSNSRRSYDVSNNYSKEFNCEDWKNFPNYLGLYEIINCEKWGCTNTGWETYWLSSLPKSWWSFLVLPDDAIAYKNNGAPIPIPSLAPTRTFTPTPIPTKPFCSQVAAGYESVGCSSNGNLGLNNSGCYNNVCYSDIHAVTGVARDCTSPNIYCRYSYRTACGIGICIAPAGSNPCYCAVPTATPTLTKTPTPTLRLCSEIAGDHYSVCSTDPNTGTNLSGCNRNTCYTDIHIVSSRDCPVYCRYYYRSSCGSGTCIPPAVANHCYCVPNSR